MASNQRTNFPQRRGPMGGGPGMNFGEKPKDFKKALKKIIKYLKPYYTSLIVAILFAIIGTTFSIIGPKLLGNITNEVQYAIDENRGIDFTKIASIAYMLIGIYLFSYLFSNIQVFIFNRITQNLSKKLRTEIVEKINKLPLSYFDKRSYGDVLSRVTNDVDTIAQTMNQSLSFFITAVTSIIGITVMMFSISWQLTLIVLIFTPVSIILISFIMKFSQKHFRKHQSSLGLVNGHIEEIYTGHSIIKTFNAHEKTKKEFTKFNNELYESGWKSQFYSGLMMPLMIFVGNVIFVIVCVVGGILAISGPIKIGNIQSMMIYIRRFMFPLSQIAQAANNFQSTAAASERVFEFLEEPELLDESNKTTYLESVSGRVEFKNVKFGYDTNNLVIKNFSAIAEPGQKIAIVGPTGAGKTTLVNLLMRFYEINEGDILIDGVSIKNLTRENVHELFGMVLQDTWLFKGTIMENLTYGKENASFEDVKKAANMANIKHFIESLPGSYQMLLEENSNISQGQKQLLTIARAMVKDSPMLILDEATSSVDTRTEILIQEAMDNLMHGRTTFVIAHRLSTIKNADLILVMNEGDIIETGTHEQLLSKNGFYAELYKSQFDKVLE